MERVGQRNRLMTERGSEGGVVERSSRRRVVCVSRGRRREVEGLTTGPSCKAMCDGKGRPSRVDMGLYDWVEGIFDRPVVEFNGL